jgi:hypothetical protein
MLKKLGVRWVPGLPLLSEQKVSQTLAKDDALEMRPPRLARLKGTALVLVLVQDSSKEIESGENCTCSAASCRYFLKYREPLLMAPIRFKIGASTSRLSTCPARAATAICGSTTTESARASSSSSTPATS